MKYLNREFGGFEYLSMYLYRAGMCPEKLEAFTPVFILKAILKIVVIQFPAIFGVMGFIFVNIKGGFYSDLLPAIYVINYTGVIQVCFIIFISRGRRTVDFLFHLVTPKFSEPKNFRKWLKIIDKLTIFLHHQTIVNGVVFGIVNYYRNAYCVAKESTNNPKIICGLLIPMWLPFEIPFMRQICLVYIIILLWHLSKQTSGNILYVGSILFIVLRIEHLKSFLKEINFEDHSPNTKKKLKLCIDYYSEISELVREMNNTIGYIFAPSQNIMVVMMIGLLEFQAVADKSIIALMQLTVWLLVEFFSCYSGQLLEDASAALSEIVYDLDWYNMDPSLRSTFKLFFGRIQLNLQLKVQPLVIMNTQYFHKVIKGSYSFLMFLNDN